MIVGIGTDMIEIPRVQKACENEHFLEKYYTESERELIEHRKVRAASHFAAKEAVSKVFGTGFSGISMQEIEILRDDFGKPYVCLHGRALELSKNLGITQIQLSISDTKEYAVAFAIGIG